MSLLFWRKNVDTGRDVVVSKDDPMPVQLVGDDADEVMQVVNGQISVALPNIEHTDDRPFMLGSAGVVPVGALADETSPDSVDEGDIGLLRMTLTRLLKVALYGKATAEGDTSIAASASGFLGAHTVNSNTGADAVANTVGFARNSSETSVLPIVGPLALAPDGSWDRLRTLADSGDGLGILKVGGAVDDAAFAASGVVMPIAGLADETAPDSVDEGDVGALRMTLTRLLKVALYGKKTTDGDQPLLNHDTYGLRTSQYAAAFTRTDGVDNAGNAPNNQAGAEYYTPIDPYLFNGTTWDRQRGNTEGTLLVSAARTATENSADQVNYNARGVRVRINVTSITATPSITVAIEEKDSISGNYIAILTSAAITTTGQKTTLVVYPGIAASANVKADDPLPRVWRVAVTHGDTDSITYSVDFALIM